MNLPDFSTDKEILLAYCAGLIDGEGCLGVYYNKVKDCYQPRLQIEMTQKEGLELLASVFPVGRWYFRTRNGNRKDVYQYLFLNSHAAQVVGLIKPYLQVKKKQAELFLKPDWFSFIGKPLTDEEKSLRQEVSQQIMELNKRGRT